MYCIQMGIHMDFVHVVQVVGNHIKFISNACLSSCIYTLYYYFKRFYFSATNDELLCFWIWFCFDVETNSM